MKFSIKEIILFAILSSILTLSQIALSFIPNVELVTLLIMIYSLIYKEKTLYIVVIFVIMMGLLHGFGTWWFGYLIIWPLFSLITCKLSKSLEGNYLRMSICSGIFGFIFGMLYTIPNIIFAGVKAGSAYYIAGIPYDIIHGTGNYFLMLFLGERIYKLITSLNNQYFQD